MRRRQADAGEGALKAIFWLALLAAVVVFSVKYVPVKIATSELYDFMNEQAKFAQAGSPEALKRGILDKAAQLNLPVQKDQCEVRKPGDRIIMQCQYEVEVDFVILKHTYHFAPMVDQPIFIF